MRIQVIPTKRDLEMHDWLPRHGPVTVACHVSFLGMSPGVRIVEQADLFGQPDVVTSFQDRDGKTVVRFGGRS